MDRALWERVSHDVGYRDTTGAVVSSRIGAAAFDAAVAGFAGTLAGGAFSVASGSTAIFFVVFGAVFVAYHAAFEARDGQTPGKRVAGIVVVDEDGGPITQEQAVVRNALRLVDGVGCYALGLYLLLDDDECQRLGDRVAETVVVRAKS